MDSRWEILDDDALVHDLRSRGQTRARHASRNLPPRAPPLASGSPDHDHVVRRVPDYLAVYDYNPWWWLLWLTSYYAVYVVCWFIEILLPPHDMAYKNICFETECQYTQDDPDYSAPLLEPLVWVVKVHFE